MIRKRFLKRTLFLAAALLGLVLVLQPAQAMVVDLKYESVSPGSFLPVTFPGTAQDAYGAGVYNLRIDGYGPVTGFCVENEASESFYNQYELLPIPAGKLTQAAWIADQYFNQGNIHDAEAAQLAIWEVVLETDSTLGLTTGNLTTASAYFAPLADAVLTALGAADLSQFDASGFLWARSPIGQQGPAVPQDYIIQRIPEPASLMLIGLGLIGLAAVSRKKFLK